MSNKNFFLIILPFIGTTLFAQNQGPNIPLNVNNTSCPFSYSSTLDFQPTSAVSVSDDSYAIANHCDCCDANTRCLETTNYGFSIPTNATITGIVVQVEKSASSGSTIEDNGVRIIKNGSTTGTDHLTTAAWPYVDAYSTYGSSTDLWGTTWTPADINATNFGVAFASISYTCFGNGKAAVSSIDHFQITVHYTTTTSIATTSLSTMKISPNPSNGIFNVEGKFEEIEVYNVLGEKVLTSSQSKIDLSDKVKGVYFLKAKSGNEVVTSKLVLN